MDWAKAVAGKQTGSFRSHQDPIGDMDHPGHVKLLEKWLKRHRPHELFGHGGHSGSGTLLRTTIG